MMFDKSVSALADNRNAVADYARNRGIDFEHAQTTMRAFASGMYLPTYEEMKAMANLPAFEKEWLQAVHSYNLLELERQGVDFSQVASRDTVQKWISGRASISKSKQQLIADVLGIDINFVPFGRRFVYEGQQGPVIRVDLRRNVLAIPGELYRFAQMLPDQYIFTFATVDALVDFQTKLLSCGAQFYAAGPLSEMTLPGNKTENARFFVPFWKQ